MFYREMFQYNWNGHLCVMSLVISMVLVGLLSSLTGCASGQSNEWTRIPGNQVPSPESEGLMLIGLKADTNINGYKKVYIKSSGNEGRTVLTVKSLVHTAEAGVWGATRVERQLSEPYTPVRWFKLTRHVGDETRILIDKVSESHRVPLKQGDLVAFFWLAEEKLAYVKHVPGALESSMGLDIGDERIVNLQGKPINR